MQNEVLAETVDQDAGYLDGIKVMYIRMLFIQEKLLLYIYSKNGGFYQQFNFFFYITQLG